MRRLLSLLALLGASSLLAACSDSTSPARTTAPGIHADVVAPDTGLVRATLNSIYPTTGVGTAANAQLTNLFRSISSAKTTSARQQAAALCGFTKTQAAAGRLHAPDVNTTLENAVTNLCDELYMSVGLGPGGIDVSGQDAIAVYVPACSPANIILPDSQALVRWPAKDQPTNSICTFNQDVTLVITPIDYTAFAPGSGPLASPTTQWPRFYDITTIPLVQPNNPVTVGICQLEDGSAYEAPLGIHDRLRIGHNRSASAPGGAGFEILPQVFLSHADLPCIPAANIGFNLEGTLRDSGFVAAAGGAARYLARATVSALTPTPAYAGHGGLAGLTSSFSPFGAVDGLLASGVGTDPAGDALPYSLPSTVVPPSPDLVAGSDSVIGTEHRFVLALTSGTFSPSTDLLTINIDSDTLPSTGSPGTDAGGNDAGLIGTDYIIDIGGEYGTSYARIFKYTGSPNSFMPTDSVPVFFSGGTVYLNVPTAKLGNAAKINFKVTSAAALSTAPSWGYTGVLDYMTNLGSLPIRIR